MAEPRSTRVQLCGRLVVELDGRRVEDAIPGGKGRLLFAYLVLNRDRRSTRDELLTAVYGEDASPEQHPSLNVLLSKLRAVVGQERVAGRAEIELLLPRDAFVDVEAAREALHRAESCIAAGQWAESWGPAGVAYHVARRPLLQSEDRPWLDAWRGRLESIMLRGLECLAKARLELGGPTLAQAEDAARRLIELAPHREAGHRILIEALERRGNVAEAILAYDQLRVMLREELGVAPGPELQGLHRRLLGERTTSSG